MEYFECRSVFAIFTILLVLAGVFCNASDIKHHALDATSMHSHDSHYVDPDSRYFVPYQRESNSIDHSKEIMLRSVKRDYQSHCGDNPYEVFSMKLINLLILKSNFKIKDDIALGHLDLEATIEELDILRGFGKGRISIREIDGIINDIIRSQQISLFDEAMNYTDRLSIYLYEHRIIFGSILLIIFVIILALKVNWTRLRIVFLLFDIFFIISFMLTWWELLQEVQIKLAAQQHIYSSMPDECRTNQISFMKSVWLFFGFSRGDCLKYFEAVMADPVLKVTPLHALSHMSSKFVFYPLSIAGHYLSSFIDSLTNTLPWPFNIIVRLVLVIMAPGIVVILLVVYSGASMGLKFGPFFHVYLHGKQNSPTSNTLMNTDRQTIEIIRSEINEALQNTEIKEAVKEKRSPKSTKLSAETPRENVKVSTKSQENVSEKCTGTKSPTEIETVDLSECAKNEENDNSDEFPEEKEYEKISIQKASDRWQTNETTDFKQSEYKNLHGDNEETETILKHRNKKSLDIVSTQ